MKFEHNGQQYDLNELAEEQQKDIAPSLRVLLDTKQRLSELGQEYDKLERQRARLLVEIRTLDYSLEYAQKAFQEVVTKHFGEVEVPENATSH